LIDCYSSGAATSEIAALAQSSIASLSSQNVFALDQVIITDVSLVTVIYSAVVMHEYS